MKTVRPPEPSSGSVGKAAASVAGMTLCVGAALATSWVESTGGSSIGDETGSGCTRAWGFADVRTIFSRSGCTLLVEDIADGSGAGCLDCVGVETDLVDTVADSGGVAGRSADGAV